MIRATAEFGIVSRRVPGRTGVWVDVPADSRPENEEEEMHKEEEKLAAIGVHLSRWVTTHGFAYNVSTNLRYFELIVPCGITGKRATSLEKLLGRRVEIAEAAPRITKNLGEIFDLAPRSCGRNQLDSMLPAPALQFVGADK